MGENPRDQDPTIGENPRDRWKITKKGILERVPLCTMNKMVSICSEDKGKGMVSETVGSKFLWVGTLVDCSSQWTTCDIRSLSSLHTTRITFVYGSNSYGDRSSLWQYLSLESISNASIPWVIMGDFNVVLRPSDRSGGINNWHNYHGDFPNCIMQASLQQVPYSSIHLTWHNGQSGVGIIMKKLDWIFRNQSLLVKWLVVRALFMPRQSSDHSAMDAQSETHTNMREMGDMAVKYFKELLKMAGNRVDTSVESLYPKSISIESQRQHE
ncbi:hypothetical protein SADUNF_Sadunf18G0117800 [Salix dunnii]|uniref:Endonuclease/exonuclease/phosphatase domain-containing protein n=1 Tax=Salix dunnii TaxID=1413687 RepID=A0A835MGS5_9ROSI|nr:hypothetical protein SADUNF_Sadunf18G0117800 [Salix dunnii]